MRIEKGVSNDYNPAVSSVKETAPVREISKGTSANEKRADVGVDNVINDEMLNRAVEEANKNLSQYNKVIERSVHEKTHTIMYVLRDTLTQEIIKEFPPRKIQDMIAKMWEIAGILVDERR
ncbi:MAG: flagellar protein FlaG [Clostridia bacterium]|jgi:flagellar protein FlaG|nr:flagellar protein FlaG [Clostridia bacterium]